MLLHIYKNLFIQMLREGSINQVERQGMTAGRISGGIIWGGTKQGHEYWAEIHTNLWKEGL